MADYIGLKLGNYRLVNLIGRGGFANVYQGEHIYLKTLAAIKVLKIQLIDDALEKFLQEARIIALLEHPHIVRVLEFGIEGITPFLVMSYANNGTLRQRHPRNSTLPWGTVLSYTKQVADALQYAHDHDVVHRDVKPENMLVDKNQQLQLSDFGLAVIGEHPQGEFSRSAGTTAYMAPEQLQGHPCPASDQYALGVVIYEWLCGSLPFTGSEREMAVNHLYAPPPPLHTRAPHITPAIEQVIMKALAKDQQARFASIQEFARALEQVTPFKPLLDSETAHTPSDSFSPSSPSPSLLFSEKSKTASSGATIPHSLHQQESINAASPSSFLPHLPLVVYDSPLTNNGRILPPSLNSTPYAVERPELSFSSMDASLQSSRDFEDLLPPKTPLPLPFSEFTTLNLHQIPSGADGNLPPPLQQLQGQTVTTKHRSVPRRVVLIILIAMALIAIITGIITWPRVAPHGMKPSQTQHAVLPEPVHTLAVNKTANTHKASSPPDTTHSTTGTIPASPSVAGATPGSSPRPGTTPSPAKAPTPVPIKVPTSAPSPTPTQSVPLTVAFVNPPATATGGTTITIVAQASEGGVTISLSGKARFLGSEVADSQGIASFQVKVPLKANRMILTATATDADGDQVLSSSQVIQVD